MRGVKGFLTIISGSLLCISCSHLPLPSKHILDDLLPETPNDDLNKALDALLKYYNTADESAIYAMSNESITKMLSEAGKRFDVLIAETATITHSVNMLLASLRFVMQASSQLPNSFEPGTEYNSDDLARRLESSYEQCAGYSNNDLWKRTCLAALVSRVSPFSNLFPYLSPDFVAQEIVRMLQAVAMVGDISTLDYLLAKHNLPKDDWLAGIIIPGIASGGSVESYAQIVSLIPAVAAMSLSLLFATVEYNQEELFEHLFHLVVDQMDSTEFPLDRMHNAICEQGSLKMLDCLHHRFPHHLEDNLKYKCLHHATNTGNLEIMAYLLSDQFTLHPSAIVPIINHGIRNNRKEAIKLILAYPQLWMADEFQKSFHEIFAVAAETANYYAIRKLLNCAEQHCPVNSDSSPTGLINLNGGGNLLLKRIITKDQPVILKHLLDLKSSSDNSLLRQWNVAENKYSILELACHYGRLEILRLLLHKDETGEFLIPGINDAANTNAFLVACAAGHLEIVRELLMLDMHGAPIYPHVIPAFKDNLAMFLVAKNNYNDILQFLLQKQSGPKSAYVFAGIDPTVKSNIVLKVAASEGHLAIVATLLCQAIGEDGATMYVHGFDQAAIYEALQFAVAKGHREIVEFLLQRDEDGTYRYMIDHIPNGTFRWVISRQDIAMMELLFTFPLQDCNKQVFVESIKLAASNNQKALLHTLLSALHGPLPDWNTPDGIKQIESLLIAEGYLMHPLTPDASTNYCPLISKSLVVFFIALIWVILSTD